MKHTPTPWYTAGMYFNTDNGNRVGSCSLSREGQEVANAAHIVKCVNAHDDLLRMIDELAAIVERLDETGNYQEDLFNVGKLLKNLEQTR